MLKLVSVLRKQIHIPLNSGRLLHVGDADVLSTSVDKTSEEFKVQSCANRFYTAYSY